MTIKNLTDNKIVGSKRRSHSTPQPFWPMAQLADTYAGTDLVETPAITKPIQFRIRLWATQNHGETDPPQSNW